MVKIFEMEDRSSIQSVKKYSCLTIWFIYADSADDMYMLGRRQKNFQGGNGKRRRRNSSKKPPSSLSVAG